MRLVLPSTDITMHSPEAKPFLIAIASSHDANVLAHRADLDQVEVEELVILLRGLVALGFVACFSVQPYRNPVGRNGMIEALREQIGAIVVDAVAGSAEASNDPEPAFLIPVWSFDHELDGTLASTARFLSFDLEVIATPSGDEETGIGLPGRDGLWLVHARPLKS